MIFVRLFGRVFFVYISGISDIFHIFIFIFMVSGRSGRYLESFLEALCFILTEYEPVSSHGESICVDFDL